MRFIEAIRYFANGKLNRLERKDTVIQVDNLSNPAQLAVYEKEFQVRTRTDQPINVATFHEFWEPRFNHPDAENRAVQVQPGNYKKNELLTTIETIVKHPEKKGRLTTIDFPDGTALTLTLLPLNFDTILYEVFPDGTLIPYMIRLEDVRQFEQEDLL